MRYLPLLLSLVVLAGPAHAAFRAAVVKVDITPTTPQWLMGYGPRKSTGVRDPIFHRIAALDDGKSQLFIIASDLCLFSPTVYDEVTAELKKETGIEPRQVWWTVTHSHSTPEVGPPGMYDILLKGRSDHPWDRDYCAFIKSSLIGGIKQARAQLAPARLAMGTGMSRANINRRARDVDGKISLGLNPDGPTDRQIGLIRLERPDGSPMGLIANYAMHGTVLAGSMLQISGDGPGVVAAYVEEKLGAPTLYVNGAAGNLAPIYTVQDLPRSHIGEFRVLLGDKILEANRAMGAAGDDVNLWVGETWVETPRRKDLGWSDELKAFAAKSQGGTDLVRIPVRVARINDTVLWASPVELFCEIALNVRRDSPFRHNFYFGYANGWLGYLPTAQAFRDGGYEPRTSPFTEEVERDFTEGVSAFIQGVPRK
ncbi:neutral/alkaline non-lysosomal ceramidase N-terminal domain-containing protein [Horticoccus sp. 23ND18S-11]|uniref:neutral/alkaline non-lysosomal ceramidase N-terminal domain-containing protein n=1 Tax=Horticoccus sp. 23ND18S-11 TaxID=3391832 RepID=UPI0039C8C0C7